MGTMNHTLAFPILAAVTLCSCQILFPESAAIHQHRLTVQQGSAIDETQVRELRVGLTRKQVLFLLGSPNVQDPFHPDRWDYPYYQERTSPEGLSQLDRLTLEFENGLLVRVVRTIRIDSEVAALSGSREIDTRADWFSAPGIIETELPLEEIPQADPEQTAPPDYLE